MPAEAWTRPHRRAETAETMSPGMHGALVGRGDELASVSTFLDGLAAGTSALLIEGDEGIGKTALWTEALATARAGDVRVLESRPAEPDASLSFCTLGDLLLDVLQEAGSLLPTPQREALEAAFALSDGDGTAPNQLALSLAVRGLLAGLTTSGPVLLAIDDIQWVDPPSEQLLQFALRRLPTEPVGLLATMRVGSERAGEPPARHRWERALRSGRTRRMILGPLDPDDLGAVVRDRLGPDVRRPAILWLHRVSEGNPLWAIEVGRSMLGGDSGPQDAPVPGAMRDLIRARLQRLSPATRNALVVAAVASDPTRSLVDEVLGTESASHIDQALAAGIVTVDGQRIRFTNPLMASLLSLEEAPERMRELHHRLAELATDPEDRARHLAQVPTGPDAEVAQVLEAAARTVRRRGAPNAAAELYERAEDLTPSPFQEDRRRRAVLAAEAYLDAGDPARSRARLEPLLVELPPGTARASVLQRLGWARYHEDTWVAAAGLFEQALAEAESDEALLASISLDTSLASLLAGDVQEASRRATEALERARALGAADLVAEASGIAGSMEFLLGKGVPEDLFPGTVSPETWGRPRPTLRHPNVAVGVLLKWADNLDGARSLLTTALQEATDQGIERSLPFILFHLAELECWGGDWSLAEEHASQACEIAAQTGQESSGAFALSTMALVHALRGRADQARESAEEGLILADRSGAVPARILLRSVLGIVGVSLGDFEEAGRHLGPLADNVAGVGLFEPAAFRFLGDAIETFVVLGEPDRAEVLLAQLEKRSRELKRVWGLAVAGRCRGLLASSTGDQGAAIAALEPALAAHERLSQPFELGRTLLVLGAVGRRDRQKRTARESLEQALDVFQRLGAPLWVEKAQTELGRISGRAPSPVELTPTEERVAALAAGGATNQDIASALFVSLKTVEWNLSRIYRKLGIRSRKELARWIEARPSPEDR
jgi:DNA-binding CsgD family transcriptional regulator